MGREDFLFLREPAVSEEHQERRVNSDSLNQYDHAVEEAIMLLQDTVIDIKANRLEASSWLISVLSSVGEALPAQCRHCLLAPYLSGGPRSEIYAPFVQELVSMFVIQQPEGTERLLATSPSTLCSFFNASGPAQMQRSRAFFGHFSPEGDSKFRYGAVALARFSLAHREQVWRHLRWAGPHPQAPGVVAAKQHYFCELNVPETIRELAKDGVCPEFWASEELIAAVQEAGGALVAAGAEAWASELAQWLEHADTRSSRVRKELESFLCEGSWRQRCTRLVPLLPERDQVALIRQMFDSQELEKDKIQPGIRLAFENGPWSDFDEALLASALSTAAPQLLRMLHDDEALAERWKTRAFTVRFLAAEGRHWALRRLMARAGANTLKQLRTVLLLHSFLAYASLQDAARDGSDSVRHILEQGGLGVALVEEEGSDGGDTEGQRRKRKEKERMKEKRKRRRGEQGWMDGDSDEEKGEEGAGAHAVLWRLADGGAGKSSLAQAMAGLASAAGVATSIINFDDHLVQEADTDASATLEFDPEQWKASRASALATLRHTLSLDDACRRLIIVDDTMHYRSMRGECWRSARDAPDGAAYLQLHVDCPLKTALQRNAGRKPPNRVPEDVLRRTAAAFEDPGASPCPWDKNTIRSDLLDINQIWATIWDAWDAPVLPPVDEEVEAARVAAARAATAADAMHAADVATRQLLSSTLGLLDILPSTQKAEVARKLNAERRRVLAEAGRGDAAVAIETFRERCEAVCAAHGVDNKLPER